MEGYTAIHRVYVGLSVSQHFRYLLGGPYKKDYGALGSMLRYPYLRKVARLPNKE